MLVCISPAKKLDWAEVSRSDVTTPDFSSDALSLAKTARDLSVPQLQKLMSISENLARLNHERFVAFADQPAEELGFVHTDENIVDRVVDGPDPDAAAAIQLDGVVLPETRIEYGNADAATVDAQQV